MQEPRLKVDDWVRVVDAEIIAQVQKVEYDLGHPGLRPYARVQDENGQTWTLPVAMLTPCASPLVEYAAFGILDLLREFDPSWGQVDTSALRGRIVSKVLELTQRYEETSGN